MNAELDATIGPILQVYARKAGVILTACDGDQPGVEINLFRYVKGLGLIPRVMGNIKGLQDPYRNPTTQQGFAEKLGAEPHDGHQLRRRLEGLVRADDRRQRLRAEGAQAGHARARPPRARGRAHHACTTSTCCASWAASSTTWSGPAPNPGIYCLAEHPDPKHRHYLNLYKLGEGPLYSFYTPWHLCHFEVPNTVARVVLFGDAAGSRWAGRWSRCAPSPSGICRQGEVLDDYGMYMTYGEAVNSEEMRRERYLPEGLVAGCRLKRDIPKDAVLTYDDVELPGPPRRRASRRAVRALRRRPRRRQWSHRRVNPIRRSSIAL